MSYQTIGKPVPRIEGADKVSGKTQFTADLPGSGVLWGRVLRSPVPHARIVKIDTSKAKKIPGVHAVLSGEDLPPVFVGIRMKDMPVLARERVRFVGEPVVAAAAESCEIADEALNLVDVEYSELPAVYGPVDALGPNAPRLHEDRSKYKNAPSLPEENPNLQSFMEWKNGDLEEGFKKAERILNTHLPPSLPITAILSPMPVWYVSLLTEGSRSGPQIRLPTGSGTY